MSSRVLFVGRPNVGKSSLFNAMLGFRRTIVLDLPGTTVDFIWEKHRFAADDGEMEIELGDTQGILEASDMDSVTLEVSQARAALFVVDAVSGPTPGDREIAKALHKLKIPVLLVVNKADARPESVGEFYEFGFEEVVETSAAHRAGLDLIRTWCRPFAKPIPRKIVEDAFDLEVAALEKAAAEAAAAAAGTPVDADDGSDHEPAPELLEKRPMKLAILGRPNSGKSTLVNLLAGRKVSRVSPIALTTRDPVSADFEFEGKPIRLLDTAGLRRPRSRMEDVEKFSVHATTRTIREADVVFLMIASHEAITDQDMRMLNLLTREGKPAALLLNFWDLLDHQQRDLFLKDSEFAPYLNDFRVLPISAKTGFHVDQVLSTAFKLYEKAHQRVKTSKLNEVLKKLVTDNPPPTSGRFHFNILYASQVKVNPPTFIFFTNRAHLVADHYKRYLEKRIRDRFGYKSQAVKLIFRTASKREPRASR